ncbi:MAG: M20/M25/M40 family metallo-hydrolase [Elusimicrobia bacterium]|nr:M20/M25/M40 family metallo-hydrolase [Elusimicrobiota bacterium]
MRLPAPDAKAALRTLESILVQPTAPFHERRVRAALTAALDAAGIPWGVDAAGNLLARYKRGKAAPLAMTAHMDHPGFELLSVKGRSAEARWNGQVPTFALKGLRLALYDGRTSSRIGRAVVTRGDGRKPGLVRGRPHNLIALQVPSGAKAGDFGHAELPLFERRGGKVRSKAHDNLSGCAAIVAALTHLSRRKLPGDVLALFTRAEEVGFHGCLGAIRLGSVPQDRPVVVLECSKELPGAVMGKGPVIRVGDKARVFDADLVAALEEAARALKKRRPALGVQRRLMDGGTCEASAFSLSGYRAVCLAFPLGNYHNVGAKKVEAEFIDEKDFLDGVDLLAAFAAAGVAPRGARKRLTAWLGSRFGAAELGRLKETAR